MTPLHTLLRQLRERKGLSIDQVTDVTKIRQKVLYSLEQGHYTSLPAIYIKSFLKTYGSFLGIPDEEISARIENEVLPLIKTIEIPKSTTSSLSLQPIEYTQNESITTSVKKLVVDKIRATSPNQKRTLSLPVILSYTAIIGLVILLFMYFFDKKKEIPFTSDSVADSLQSETTTKKEPLSKLFTFMNKDYPSDSLILELKAIDSVWISITIDNKKTEDIVLLPQQGRRFSAVSQYTLSTNNSKKLIARRNGKDIQLAKSNKGGAVRNIKITETKVTSSSSLWQTDVDQKKTESNTTSTSTTKPKKETTSSSTPKKKKSEREVSRPPVIKDVPIRPRN
jgi:cytoskeletal protein RodZ